MPDRYVQLPDTVRNLGPQAAILGIYQPNAAAVSSHQATCHVGIENEQGIEILCCANFGRILEDHTGNSIRWDHGSSRLITHCGTGHQSIALSWQSAPGGSHLVAHQVSASKKPAKGAAAGEEESLGMPDLL